MTSFMVELLNPGAKRILEDLEHVGLIAISEAETCGSQQGCSLSPGKTRRVMELKGLGAEIWRNESVADYIQTERESWDT